MSVRAGLAFTSTPLLPMRATAVHVGLRLRFGSVASVYLARTLPEPEVR